MNLFVVILKFQVALLNATELHISSRMPFLRGESKRPQPSRIAEVVKVVELSNGKYFVYDGRKVVEIERTFSLAHLVVIFHFFKEPVAHCVSPWWLKCT